MKTKNLNLILVIMLVLSLFACDKREDIFKETNKAPFLEINTLNTPTTNIKDFTSEVNLTDSFNYVVQNYKINFRIKDESDNVSLVYLVDKGASITLNNMSKSESDNEYLYTGEIVMTPVNIGTHTIDIVATDPYEETHRITITLHVYQRNIHPILSVSTSANYSSNNPTLTTTPVIDTFSVNQGDVIIDYQIFDDNVNYNFSFTSSNAGNIVEDLQAKNIITQPYSVIVNGQLKLTPTQLGQHTITLTVVDDVNNTTQIIFDIYITDLPANIQVNPGLNAFASTNSYVNNFNELYLMQMGNYKIKYKIIDDTPTPNFTFNSNNGGNLTENMSQRTVVTNGGISTIEGELILQVSLANTYTITLQVAEIFGTTSSISTVDIRTNSNPTIQSSALIGNGGYVTCGGSVISYNSARGQTNNVNDVDINMFNDAIASYEWELYHNNVLVLTQTSTIGTYLFTNIRTIYGTGTYHVKVRAYDSYGGVSNWSISNVHTVNC